MEISIFFYIIFIKYLHQEKTKKNFEKSKERILNSFSYSQNKFNPPPPLVNGVCDIISHYYLQNFFTRKKKRVKMLHVYFNNEIMLMLVNI